MRDLTDKLHKLPQNINNSPKYMTYTQYALRTIYLYMRNDSTKKTTIEMTLLQYLESILLQSARRFAQCHLHNSSLLFDRHRNFVYANKYA